MITTMPVYFPKILLILLIVMISATPPIYATEIRQRPYRWTCGTTLTMEDETFVIDEEKEEFLQQNLNCILAIVYFEFGKDIPSEKQMESVVAQLFRYQISSYHPLHIVGHSCSIGSDQANRTLSRKRAEYVATRLKEEGFSVKDIQGAGAAYPATFDPQALEKNRRVEIITTDARVAEHLTIPFIQNPTQGVPHEIRN